MASRKFILALLSLAAASTLVWVGAIDGPAFSATVLCTVGAYMAANVYQKKETK